MSGVGLMAWVVGLGWDARGPEFKSCLVIELIPGVADSVCHPCEVGKMSASLLVSCRSGDPSRIVPNCPGDCFGSTNRSVQSMVLMDGWMGWKLSNERVKRLS